MKTIDALKSLGKLLMAGEWTQIEKIGPGTVGMVLLRDLLYLWDQSRVIVKLPQAPEVRPPDH